MSGNKKDSIYRRSQYVQNEVKKRGGKVEAVVNDLAAELFLNERTIWRDLTRELKPK